MGRFDADDEMAQRAFAEGRKLHGGAMDERHAKAIEAARERAKQPEPETDPSLPKWWEGLDKPE